MIKEICKELVELVIFFFLIFIGLCLCDIANRQSIHDQAVYDAQFKTFDFEIPTGWEDAIIKPQ